MTTTRSPLRPLVRGLVAALAAAVAIAIVPATAQAAVVAEAEVRVHQLLQQAREQAGLAPLTLAGDLSEVARRHSVRMADAGRLFHDQDLNTQVSGWRALGENVGRGVTPDRVHEQWMSSDGHRANLLGPGFHDVGIGVEQRGDTLWITQVFRERSSSPEPDPEPAPGPAPAPAAEPAPEPAPAPAAEPREAVAEAPAEPQPSGDAVGQVRAASVSYRVAIGSTMVEVAPAPRPSLVGDRLARALAVTDVADGGPTPGELLLSTGHDARG